MYRINIDSGVVEKTDSFDCRITDCAFYKDTIYLATEQWAGNHIHRSLRTYDLSSGKTTLFARLGDTADEEQRTCVDICGGYLWAYQYGSADYQGYSNPQKFEVK